MLELECRQDLLLHVAAKAPAEVLAALMQLLHQHQQKQCDATAGWECTLLPAVLCKLSGGEHLSNRLWRFWERLAAAAVPEQLLRRTVVDLLQCMSSATSTLGSSSSSSSNDIAPVLVSVGDAGSNTVTPQLLLCSALTAVQAICSKQLGEGKPGHVVLLSLLTDPQHLQQLLQALLHCCCSPRTNRDRYQAGEVQFYARLYKQLWEIPQIAEQPQMVASLQQLISAALQTGDEAAVLMLTPLARNPAAAAVLGDQAADVLAAVRRPRQSQQQQ
jgi:hypothetical protein